MALISAVPTQWLYYHQRVRYPIVWSIGPLYVASFKGANMVVAGRKTRTFF